MYNYEINGNACQAEFKILFEFARIANGPGMSAAVRLSRAAPPSVLGSVARHCRTSRPTVEHSVGRWWRTTEPTAVSSHAKTYLICFSGVNGRTYPIALPPTRKNPQQSPTPLAWKRTWSYIYAYPDHEKISFRGGRSFRFRVIAIPPFREIRHAPSSMPSDRLVSSEITSTSSPEASRVR